MKALVSITAQLTNRRVLSNAHYPCFFIRKSGYNDYPIGISVLIKPTARESWFTTDSLWHTRVGAKCQVYFVKC